MTIRANLKRYVFSSKSCLLEASPVPEAKTPHHVGRRRHQRRNKKFNCSKCVSTHWFYRGWLNTHMNVFLSGCRPTHKLRMRQTFLLQSEHMHLNQHLTRLRHTKHAVLRLSPLLYISFSSSVFFYDILYFFSVYLALSLSPISNRPLQTLGLQNLPSKIYFREGRSC